MYCGLIDAGWGGVFKDNVGGMSRSKKEAGRV